MLQVITMTAYRRPAYTREVLDALKKCDGITNWVLLPNIEPGYEDVSNAFRDFTACESRPIVNNCRLGLNKNTFDVLSRALELRADITIHLEDDTVPSPDALHYFDWAVKELLIPDVRSPDGHQILLASGYNKPQLEPGLEQTYTCATRPIWSPWGWAVDRGRLSWLLGNWCSRNKKCFTCHFKSTYRRTRREVFPALSRIQNIGYELGENGRTPEWYRTNHRTPWVASERAIGEFRFAGS